jgi:ribA/ribD-fused uncharacterized protein
MEQYEPFEKIDFATVEHYYQAMKTLNYTQRRTFAMSSNPADAKKMGRQIQIRSDWENVKIAVMRNALWQKFKDPELAGMLVSTHPRKLVEGNEWGDKFWGIFKGEGLNMLGQLLMATRERLMTGRRNLEIYTAQYRYSGDDRLDITVKGQHPLGRIFAPTWNIVLASKNGSITQPDYVSEYYSMMLKSYNMYPHVWHYILSLDTVTFVCFCRPGEFCHRVLLTDYFKQMGATYMGERSV